MTRHATTIDPDLDPTLLPAVQAADVVLDDVLGDPAPRVRAEWGAAADGGAVLRLTDAEVTRTRAFRRGELAHERNLRYDLRDVWREVLQERYRIQHRRVLESLSAGGD
jgi:hypothetical protein